MQSFSNPTNSQPTRCPSGSLDGRTAAERRYDEAFEAYHAAQSPAEKARLGAAVSRAQTERVMEIMIAELGGA